MVVVSERHATRTFWDRVDVGFEVGQEASDYFVMILKISLILKLLLRDDQIMMTGPLRRYRDCSNSVDRRHVRIQGTGVLLLHWLGREVFHGGLVNHLPLRQG